MNTKERILLAFFLLFLYLIIIGQLSYFIPNLEKEVNSSTEKLEYSSGTTIIQEVGVSDSISVQVIRNPWYGKIEENGDSSTLYLFRLIRIPLKQYWVNFKNLHILFFVGLLFLLKGGIKMKKGLEITFILITSFLFMLFIALDIGIALLISMFYTFSKRKKEEKDY